MTQVIQLCFRCSDKKIRGYISERGVFDQTGKCVDCGKEKPIVIFMRDYSYMTYHLMKRLGFYSCILGKGMKP